MPDTLTILTFLFGLLGLALLVGAVVSLRRANLFRFANRFTLATALFALSAGFAILTISTQGYRAFTHEDVAAVVDIQPLGPQRFRASLHLPDGQVSSYVIAGDEFYIDAHILKWKPIANLLGLHTAYALDRIGGRYRTLEDERHAPRTVYRVGTKHFMDLFDLRQRYATLAPLLDAEYGSATFVTVDGPATLEVRVSTTGLLIRKAGHFKVEDSSELPRQ